MKEVGDWHRLTRPGTYTIRVEAKFAGRVYESNPVTLPVVTGLVLAETQQVLPGYPDRQRRYGLRYWKRDGHEHLFLRVDETVAGVNWNYGSVDLGRLVRFFQPTLSVDREGRVRVVHQSGRDRMTRSFFKSDPDQLRFVNQTHHLPTGEPYPGLRLDEGERGRSAPVPDGAPDPERAQPEAP